MPITQVALSPAKVNSVPTAIASGLKLERTRQSPPPHGWRLWTLMATLIAIYQQLWLTGYVKDYTASDITTYRHEGERVIQSPPPRYIKQI